MKTGTAIRGVCDAMDGRFLRAACLVYSEAGRLSVRGATGSVFTEAFFKKTGEAPPARPRRGGSDSGKARGHQARRFP